MAEREVRILLTGIIFIDDKMAIGWKEVDGDWYYFDDSGAAATDWLLSGGKWFYFDYIDYTMETGSREIDGVNYNFREDGSLIE